MSHLTDKELANLGARGLLVGPHENEEAFFLRIQEKMTTSRPPIQLENIFSILPDWVEIKDSNKNLLPWQGGFTEIEGRNIFIQLRKGEGKIWMVYSKEELLAHELVHAARMAFEEPIFEEILAYQTSHSKFRRFYGPIFRTSLESLFFLTTLLTLAIVNLFYMITEFLIVGSLIPLSFFLWRLCANQRKFRRARQNLKSFLGCEKKALSFLLSLTDQEIFLFSSANTSEIKAYISRQTSLRWRQMRVRFLDGMSLAS